MQAERVAARNRERANPEIQSLINLLQHADLDLLGTACIDWPYSKDSYGYGQVRRDGRTILVNHVVLPARSARPAPPFHQILHRCDNPPCVNPRHLRWGSQGQNISESYQRGRRK